MTVGTALQAEACVTYPQFSCGNYRRELQEELQEGAARDAESEAQCGSQPIFEKGRATVPTYRRDSSHAIEPLRRDSSHVDNSARAAGYPPRGSDGDRAGKCSGERSRNRPPGSSRTRASG